MRGHLGTPEEQLVSRVEEWWAASTAVDGKSVWGGIWAKEGPHPHLYICSSSLRAPMLWAQPVPAQKAHCEDCVRTTRTSPTSGLRLLLHHRPDRPQAVANISTVMLYIMFTLTLRIKASSIRSSSSSYSANLRTLYSTHFSYTKLALRASQVHRHTLRTIVSPTNMHTQTCTHTHSAKCSHTH